MLGYTGKPITDIVNIGIGDGCFSAKKLSAEQAEEIGIAISIDNGVSTGLLNEEEKNNFLNRLK